MGALLDQVSAGQLRRLAGASPPAAARGAAGPPRPRGLGRGLRRVVGRILTPLALLTFSTASVIGVVAASIQLTASGELWTLVGVARLTIVVLAVLAVLGQARALLMRAWRPGHHRRHAAPRSRPLLDLADINAFAAQAPATPSIPGDWSRSRLRRAVDDLGWVVVNGLALGLTGAVLVALLLSLGERLGAELGPSLALVLVFSALGAWGWGLMARQVIVAILERRRRRRRPALLRLLRSLLRLIRGETPARVGPLTAAASGATAVSLLAMVLAATIAAGAGIGPDLPRDDGISLGAGGGTPATLAPSVPRATPIAGSTPTPGFLGEPEPTSSVAPVPSHSPVSSERSSAPSTVRPSPSGGPHVTQPPTPTLAPTPAPSAKPTPKITPAPQPTPTPTPTPVPTLDPSADADGDTIPTGIEVQYGSDPLDKDSTPESHQYDLDWNKGTCFDQVDNDLDTLVDAKDPACA